MSPPRGSCSRMAVAASRASRCGSRPRTYHAPLAFVNAVTADLAVELPVHRPEHWSRFVVGAVAEQALPTVSWSSQKKTGPRLAKPALTPFCAGSYIAVTIVDW